MTPNDERIDINDSAEINISDDRTLAIQSTGIAKRGLDLALLLEKRILQVPKQYSSIEDALESAHDGDIIELAPGDYQWKITINKSITIRGKGENVNIHPKINSYSLHPINEIFSEFDTDAQAFIEINKPQLKLILEKLNFFGAEAVYCPPAIRIENGNVEIKHCTFRGFILRNNIFQYLNDRERNQFFEYKGYQVLENTRATIEVFGPSTTVIIINCGFYSCWTSIDAKNGCEIKISQNLFGASAGCFITNSTLLSDHNLFHGIFGDFPSFIIQGNVWISSNFDSFWTHNLIECKFKGKKRIYLNHATINCYFLLSWSWRSYRYSHEKSEEYFFQKPKISIEESIIFPLNLKMERGAIVVSNLINEGFIKLKKNNLLSLKDDDEKTMPGLGKIIDTSISLNQNSPAIKAAKDGTNLGAWQG